MSDLKISQLQELFNPYISDVIPIVHEGITKKASIDTVSKVLSSALYAQVSSVNTLVQSNSAVWNTAGEYQGTDIKDLSSNWQSTYNTFNVVSSTFLTSETDSQTLSFDEETKDLSISNGNIISLSSLIDNTATDTGVRLLTGNWQRSYNTVQSNSATNWNYQGTDLKNLSSEWVGGNDAFTNLASNSAAYLSSVDLSFLSISGNWNSVYNTVQTNSAVNWNYQGTDLKTLSADWQNTFSTVQSNSAVWLEGGSASDFAVRTLSGNWESTYTTFKNASSTFLTSETDSQNLSFDEETKDLSISNGNTISLSALVDRVAIDTGVRTLTSVWDSTYNTVQSNSAVWLEGGSASDFAIRSLTASYDSTYSTVQSNSATVWNYQGTDIKDLTGNWVGGNIAFTNLVANSAAYLSAVDLSFLGVSADWDSVYNTVLANSAANWNYQGTDLKELSANWESTYTTFKNASSTFLTSETDSQNLSFDEETKDLSISNGNTISLSALIDNTATDTGVRTLTSVWDSTYNTVQSNSAVWLEGGSASDFAIRSLTASYDSAYNTVLANSATNWNYQGTDVKNLSSGWVGGNVAFTNLASNSAAYLSSIDLSFLSVSANWNSVYSTVQSNSATTWNYQGTDLKALTGNYSSVYTNVNSNSSNWSSVYSNVQTNSASYAAISFVDAKFLPLTGGTVTGTTQFNNNLTVYGNISATGVSYFSNTVYSTTSALSVINIGNSGPALFIGNNGTGDIASFYDLDQNIEVLHVGGNNGSFPNVGVKTSEPNKDFTVKGEISASGDMWTSGRILSGGRELLSFITPNINSVYSNVQTNSANYILDGGNTKGSNLLIGTNDTFNLSLETNNTTRLTILSSGSIGINETSPEGRLHVTAGSAGTVVAQPSSVGVFESSGNAYLSLLSPTSHYAGVVMGGPTNPYGSYVNWNHDNLALKVATNHTGASIQMLIGTEQEVMRITSAGNVGIGTTAPSEKLTVAGNISASGNLYGNASTLTNVIDAGVRALSANWQNTYTNFSTQSANNVSVYTNVQANSANRDSVYSSVRSASANWNSVYSNVQANSAANWNYQGTDLKTLSANWQNTYTNFSVQSANNASVYSSVNLVSANWNSVYTNVQANSAKWILEDFIVACSDESTALTISTSAVTFRVPFGLYLNSIRASVNVAPVGSAIVVDVKQTGTSIFSTKLSIDANEETSTTAATPVVISNPNLTDDAKIIVSIDQVGSSTPGKGLKLTFKGYRV
jgi:hypothetical protein